MKGEETYKSIDDYEISPIHIIAIINYGDYRYVYKFNKNNISDFSVSDVHKDVLIGSLWILDEDEEERVYDFYNCTSAGKDVNIF